MPRLIAPALGIALFPCFLASTSLPAAHPLLGPTDIIYAIDRDYSGPVTWPGGEAPGNVLDGNSGTKYLNFGRTWSGLIVTPGASTVQSLRFTTANDAPDRDPMRYQLYGTMDPITSTGGGQGRSENWTPIGGGALNLPTARFDSTTVVDLPNNASYTSYKLLFPGVRNDGANSMQIADVQMYSSPGGAGAALLAAGQPVVAVDDNGIRDGESRYPGGEAPRYVLDGNVNTKYLNFGENNSGFIVVPDVGSSVVTGFELWTANDSPERDPAAYELYGHMGSVQFGDNSLGDLDDWALISSGSLSLPTDRQTSGGMVTFANDLHFDAYRFVVTSVRDSGAANSMQFSDIQFYGVPEPSSIAMSVIGLGFAGWQIRRRVRR
jgi:hypothetical protein